MKKINYYKRDRDGMEQTAEAGTDLDETFARDPEYRLVDGPIEPQKSQGSESQKSREHAKEHAKTRAKDNAPKSK